MLVMKKVVILETLMPVTDLVNTIFLLFLSNQISSGVIMPHPDPVLLKVPLILSFGTEKVFIFKTFHRFF